MVRVVDCHAGVLGSNPGGPKIFSPWSYFTKYAELSDWTAEECLDCLSWCLTEKAADFCATLKRTKHLSYRKLLKRLDDRFGDREFDSFSSGAVSTGDPEERRIFGRLGGSSVDPIWQRFKELPEKYSNQQAVARFCQGLNDAEAGLCVCMRNPSSMGDALNEIKLYQHTKDAIYDHRK